MGRMKEYLEEYNILVALADRGYLYDNGSINHMKMVNDKVWVNPVNGLVEYKDLTSEYLDELIKKFKAGLFRNTQWEAHYLGLMQEYYRRTTKAGKILYE